MGKKCREPLLSYLTVCLLGVSLISQVVVLYLCVHTRLCVCVYIYIFFYVISKCKHSVFTAFLQYFEHSTVCSFTHSPIHLFKQHLLSTYYSFPAIKSHVRASLVAQWLRIRLPMQGTRVQALVWEDPTCRGATKPMHHNYWACALKPACHNYWSPHTQSPCSATKRSHRSEKPAHHNKE